MIAARPATSDAPCTRIEMYSREGCPHCRDAKMFLSRLGRDRPELRIEIRDVVQEPAALERLRALARTHGSKGLAVPAFDVCGVFLVGFDGPESTGARIEGLLGSTQAGFNASIDLPGLGTVDVGELGLPAFTLAVGLVDGLNPCALWVLLFLLSILVNLRDRTRILIVAGTFVFISGAAYFLFMAAWLNVFLWIGYSRVVQASLGAIAIGVGALHVKDFFAFGRGPSLSIPEAAKPGIYARVRGIVQAENLAGALAAAIVLAVLVNFVELLCTAGLPALYTQILTLQGLSTPSYYGYLLLYNLAYVLDDIVLVSLVVVTLGRRKLREDQGRWLKLVSGGVMLVLGIVLLARPDWMVG